MAPNSRWKRSSGKQGYAHGDYFPAPGACLPIQAVSGFSAAGATLGLKMAGLTLTAVDDRLINGTTEWQRYELVLPASRTAVGIAFKIGLLGKGQAWIDDVKIEALNADAPKTGNIPEHRLEPEEMELHKRILTSYGSQPVTVVNADFER